MPEAPAPTPPSSQPSSVLTGLKPDELFARGMQSVKITGAGGLGTWEPPSIDEVARLFPNYEIQDLIGRGGMGAVYKARQLALDRLICIKLLPLEVSVDRDFAERFKREARTMARLNHPNIVSVFDFGTTAEGHLYFVMEYVEGTTLHHLIKSTGLKPNQALEIIVGVCEALNYAHAEGIVHRDIKPANVLVDVRGRVKVTDFGLARLSGPSAAEQAGYTMTGTVLGTPDYMAPEQKRGMHVDHRADIYSLGVMLYEMLCRQVPQGVFDLPSRLVSVDERVDQVVIRAMQQEPDRRYQNTAEMKHEVQTIRTSRDPHAMAPKPRVGAPAHASKTKAYLVAGAAVLAVVATAVIYQRNRDDARIPTAPDVKNRLAENRGSTPAPKTATAPAESKPTTTVEPAVEKPATTSTVAIIPPSPTPAPAAPAPAVGIAVVPTPPPATAIPGVPPPAAPPTVTLTPNPATTLTRPPDPRPVANPDMAAAVAQLGPDPSPANATNSAPTPALEDWQRFTEQAEGLMRRRDPEGAIQALNQALEAVDTATIPPPAHEVARLYQRMGALEAALGSTAEARGSFEMAKRVLQQARTGGKLPPEAARVLGEIEADLRRLPRDE
jgi:serine/threonine protein kinase